VRRLKQAWCQPRNLTRSVAGTTQRQALPAFWPYGKEKTLFSTRWIRSWAEEAGWGRLRWLRPTGRAAGISHPMAHTWRWSTRISTGGRIEVLTLSDGTCHELSPELQGHDLYSIGWAADGKSFFAVSRLRDSLDLLHVTLAGKVQTMLSPEGYQNQFLRGPLASPDGRYLAFKAQTWDGNVWMIDNFR